MKPKKKEIQLLAGGDCICKMGFICDRHRKKYEYLEEDEVNDEDLIVYKRFSVG